MTPPRRNLKVDFPPRRLPFAFMIFALPFPDISPTLFSVEIGGITLALRWYALAYLAGLLIGLWIVRAVVSRPRLWPGDTAPMTRDQAEALLTSVILGVVIGGRLGFVLFYQPGYYLANPLDIPKVWQGGMSFHGGFAGVVVASALFCLRHRLPALRIADALALSAPPGLMLGRLANFINAELWGRPTTLPWGVLFPGNAAQTCPPGWTDLCARHPSQLYQAGLEGLVLGAVLVWLVVRCDALKTPGRVVGAFLLGYGLARLVVEFARQADAQFITANNPLGHVVSVGAMGLTMGQVLSLPLIAAGALILLIVRRGRAA